MPAKLPPMASGRPAIPPASRPRPWPRASAASQTTAIESQARRKTANTLTARAAKRMARPSAARGCKRARAANTTATASTSNAGARPPRAVITAAPATAAVRRSQSMGDCPNFRGTRGVALRAACFAAKMGLSPFRRGQAAISTTASAAQLSARSSGAAIMPADPAAIQAAAMPAITAVTAAADGVAGSASAGVSACVCRRIAMSVSRRRLTRRRGCRPGGPRKSRRRC